MKSLLACVISSALCAGTVAGLDEPPGATQKRQPNFTISKETTFVTGPVDKDGYIDYVTALNDRLRVGVTPANNANVLLWRAMGPHPQGATMPPEFFKALGIEVPQDEGSYFVELHRYLKEHLKLDDEQLKKIDDQLTAARKRPWKPEEYPEVAGWLKINEEPLKLVVEASKRSEYYSPLIPTPKDDTEPRLLNTRLPGVQNCRVFGYALAARAMLHVGHGRTDAAWQDLLACHRLGRLMTRGGTLIEGLVGIAIDGIACATDVSFVGYASLTSAQIRACLQDLQSLPPRRDMADVVNQGERFMFLDCIMTLDRGGAAAFKALGEGGNDDDTDFITKAALNHVHWDRALKNANNCYDLLTAIMKEKNLREREKQWSAFEESLKALKIRSTGLAAATKFYLAGDQGRGEVIGDVLIALMLPAANKIGTAADRDEQAHRNLHLAFALAAYQRDRGGYPEKLDELAPKYLASIPDDLFSGQPLIYTRSADGYLLYSVGPNLKDDGGRSYEEHSTDYDMPIRMPKK